MCCGAADIDYTLCPLLLLLLLLILAATVQ
jgi:hypothetical protein